MHVKIENAYISDMAIIMNFIELGTWRTFEECALVLYLILSVSHMYFVFKLMSFM